MTTKTPTPAQSVATWFAEHLPEGWFMGEPTVTLDGEEILVVGTLPDGTDFGRFRADTRDERMKIADQAQRRFHRTLSWGARAGDVEQLFTTVSSPVMTRLRLPERAVLDTLVSAGVARSRSEALGWCVRLVARHQAEWLDDLREALTHVEQARTEGPVAV